jgi:hypothetical protein
MNVSARRLPEEHLQLVLHGVLGVLHNRFSQVWDPAMECLSFLIRNYRDAVWDKYVEYLAVLQNTVLSHVDQLGWHGGADSASLGRCSLSQLSPSLSHTHTHVCKGWCNYLNCWYFVMLYCLHVFYSNSNFNRIKISSSPVTKVKPKPLYDVSIFKQFIY